MPVKTLIFLAVAAAEPASSVTAPPPVPPAERQMGGVMAPAVLPAGDLALWGLMGAPDVGAGYRQGFSLLEVEARALFNYLELSGVAEAGVKVPVLRRARTVIAVGGALGLKLNSGARYYDPANFAFVALRPRFSAHLSSYLTETIQLVALVELPFAIPLASAGVQLTPTAGAGAEFHLGGRLTLLASAHLGLDAIKEPLGVTQLRPAWAVRLGVGYRVF